MLTANHSESDNSCRKKPAARTRRRFRSAIAKFGRLALLALQIQRERQRLLTMDDRALKDIGLGRADALREADRPLGEILRGRCSHDNATSNRRTVV